MVYDHFILGLVVFSIAWLIVLTLLFVRQVRHYNKLVGRNKGDLREILENILQDRHELEQHIIKVENQLEFFEKKSLTFIQKTGLIKFSPYAETGGNQSFALCVLDAQFNGFVMLSLHGRDGTRIYVKSVEEGKSKLELSLEEQGAIDLAKKQ